MFSIGDKNAYLIDSNFFQVVGDRKGAVFGGLVEAPLRPTNKRKYQVLLIRCFPLILLDDVFFEKHVNIEFWTGNKQYLCFYK